MEHSADLSSPEQPLPAQQKHREPIRINKMGSTEGRHSFSRTLLRNCGVGGCSGMVIVVERRPFLLQAFLFNQFQLLRGELILFHDPLFRFRHGNSLILGLDKCLENGLPLFERQSFGGHSTHILPQVQNWANTFTRWRIRQPNLSAMDAGREKRCGYRNIRYRRCRIRVKNGKWGNFLPAGSPYLPPCEDTPCSVWL